MGWGRQKQTQTSRSVLEPRALSHRAGLYREAGEHGKDAKVVIFSRGQESNTHEGRGQGANPRYWWNLWQTGPGSPQQRAKSSLFPKTLRAKPACLLWPPAFDFKALESIGPELERQPRHLLAGCPQLREFTSRVSASCLLPCCVTLGNDLMSLSLAGLICGVRTIRVATPRGHYDNWVRQCTAHTERTI